jgi:hypothetical protein
VILTAPTLTLSQETAKKGESGQAENSSAPPVKKITFKLQRMSDGVRADGRWFHTHTYLSSDGQKVSFTYITFDSDAAAAGEIDRVIHGASKVLERGLRKNEEGKTIGERVVALFVTKDPPKAIAKLIRTNDQFYCEVDSESLQEVLEFERRPRP